MLEPVRLRFKIHAYTPSTIPMGRLAKYLQHLATLLGETKCVHLVNIEEGTTTSVLDVEREAYPTVMERTKAVRNGDGPESAQKAKRIIEQCLVEDNAPYGHLLDESDTNLMDFIGANIIGDPEYGPFAQYGTLDGVPIAVGGKNDPVPVHLQTPDSVHYCLASRDVAKSISQHLFTTPLRVSGTGRWFRDSDGLWSMISFRITDYTALRSESLSTVTEQLQAIDADWKVVNDPLGTLTTLRELDD